MSIKLRAFFDVSAKHRELVRELRYHYPKTEEKLAQYKELIKEENENRNKKREYLFTGTVEKRLGRFSLKYDVVNDWGEDVFALWNWRR
jgi:hypothetical protein